MFKEHGKKLNVFLLAVILLGQVQPVVVSAEQIVANNQKAEDSTTTNNNEKAADEAAISADNTEKTSDTTSTDESSTQEDATVDNSDTNDTESTVDAKEATSTKEEVKPTSDEKATYNVETKLSSDSKAKVLSVGDIVKNTIKITNTSDVDGKEIPVKDSLYGNLPDYLTIEKKFASDDSENHFTGDLKDNNFKLSKLAAGKSAIFTYELKIKSIPASTKITTEVTSDDKKASSDIAVAGGSKVRSALNAAKATAKALGAPSPIIPSADFNVINFDAPAGHVVDGESNLEGVNNGKKHVDSPTHKVHQVPNGQKYLSMDAPGGHLNPDGSVSYPDTSDDGGIRREYEGMFFPLNTPSKDWNADNWDEQERTSQSEYVTVMYPKAIFVNGTYYDVKAKFSDFQKTKDSLAGSDPLGFYTTLVVSHYFYDGYYLMDFQSLKEELTIYDESGNEVNLQDLTDAYKMKFGMFSINGYNENGQEQKNEGMQPLAGLNNAKTYNNVQNKYFQILNAQAYEGMSNDESNGVSFDLTSGTTVSFKVGKNPTWNGDNWWDIAWFVPTFWAEDPIIETELDKSVKDENGDGVAQVGEKLEYTIKVSNKSPLVEANDVAIRDTLAENVPPYLTFNNDVTLTPDVGSTGDLRTGTFKIDSIPADSTVEVHYTMTVKEIPTDVADITNFATDNGKDPEECDEETEDCSGTVTPIDGDANLEKHVVDENNNGIAEEGEKLTYTISLDNPGKNDAEDINVRDTLIENTPDWLTYNDDVKVNPSDIDTTGDLKDGDFTISRVPGNSTVTITYTMTVGEIPADVSNIENIATDDGSQTCDPDTEDCAEVVIPVEGDTTIDKSVVDENDDDIAQAGETLTYTIDVKNDTDADAHKVPIRDTMLENIPDYIQFNNDVTISPNDLDVNGSLEDGTYVIDTVPANSTATITYTVTLKEVPDDIKEILNIATDNGKDTCDPKTDDCDQVVIPVNADTSITKKVDDESADNIAQVGEKLTYTLAVTNNSATASAQDVPVRDTMLENTPSYLTFNDDVVVKTADTTGSLTDGTFKISDIGPGETVYITYSVTVDSIPSDLTEIANIATDDGKDTCDPDTEDCDNVVIPVEGDTSIKKSVKDEDNDGLVSEGETLTYTLDLSNDTVADAHQVAVRDTLLENLPSYISFNNDVVVDPSTISSSGDLSKGTFVIDTVKAGEDVKITYSVTVNDIPDDIKEVENIATNNGTDTCEPDTDKCDEVIVPIKANTNIEKTISDANGDGFAQKGEVLTYTIKVSDTNAQVDALDVPVRDMLIENTPSWLTYNDDATISPNVATTGDLKDGSYVVSTVKADSAVTITYTMTINELPTDADSIINIATDNGETTDTCTETEAKEQNIFQKLFGLKTERYTDCDSTIIPIDGDAPVQKFVTDENENGIAEVGEALNYTLQITNSNKAAVENMPVRDTLLENTPSWLTFNNDVKIDPSDINTTGSLTNGDFVITEIPGKTTVNITFSLTVNDIPADVAEIENIVTNDGSNTCDPDTDHCDEVVIPVEGNTIISKSVSDESDDNVAQKGEVLTYTLDVKNNTLTDAHNVEVRDTLLENLPPYLTFNNDVKVDPTDIVTTGDLTKGTFTIDTVKPDQTVKISFSVTVNDIPNDIANVTNIATDNGTDTCTEADKDTDCGEVVTPVEPDTSIEKSVKDETNDGKVEAGETLTYTLDVANNNTEVDAHNVPVRDTLLENLPDYVTFNNDVTLTPTTATSTGELTTGDFSIDTIPANTHVKITFSITVNSIPDDIKEIDNIATDNGSNTCNPDTDDCSEVVTPVVPDTVIEKAITDASGDNIAQKDEVLTYTIKVSNTNNLVDASNVPVRDMLIENTPSWLTYNDDATIKPSTATTGDLKDGSYEVSTIAAGSSIEITYTMTMNEIPTDVANIINIATDNGETIDSCDEDSKDCGSTIIPIDGDTALEKLVTDENGNGIAELGETLNYTIKVTNKDKAVATDVPVKDTLLEDTPSWLTFNDDVKIDPSDIVTTGDLTAGDFVIDSIDANGVVTITYSMTVNAIPSDVTDVTNIATDNGESTCDPDTEDCDTVVVPVEGDTVITKAVSDASGDNVVQANETLTYTLDVKNNTAADAHNVAVRDTLLENLPSWLTFNNDVTVNPTSTVTSGTLTGGDFTIDTVKPGEDIKITFTVTAGEIPDDVANVTNIATDNGKDTCPDEDKGTDCGEVVTPVEPDTSIDKVVKDENNDGKVEAGETLTYTLAVTNDNSEVDASNIPVRDTLLENLPDYVTYNNDMALNPSDISSTGDLTAGDFEINKIPAGDTVHITYSITVNSIPDNITEIENIATDSGDLICDEDTEDCESVIVPVVPNTVIEKSIVDANGDGFAQKGEDLTYTIKVSNTNTEVDALDVPVRDMLIENTPAWLTYNNDATIKPTVETSGSLNDGTYVVSQIDAGSSIEITYTMNLKDIPTDVDSIINIATDNGETTDVCEPAPARKQSILERLFSPKTELGTDCDSTIIPIDGDAPVEKFVTDENGNGIAELGETLNYTLQITNSNKSTVENMAIRDTLLENTPAWLTFNDDVAIDPSTIATTGDLTNGDYVITEVPGETTVNITYSMTVNEIPKDATEIANIVTNDGSNTCDPDTDHCDEVVVPVEGNTIINKSVKDQSNDGIAQKGEELTYTLNVKNNTATDAHDVLVRDTLLENLPSWLTFNNNVTIDPSDLSTTGDLESGNYTIDTIKPGQEVNITFSVTVNDIPNNVENVTNIATDNGTDTCTEEENGTDCGEVVTPIEPDTSIEKSVKDENNDGKVETGETLTYTLDVTNNNTLVDAHNVPVRDTLLEKLPDYVTFNNDVTLTPTTATSTGDLTAGNFTIDTIKANTHVLVTFSITVNSIPDDIKEIDNIATDNGSNTCDPDTDDCSEVVTPVVPDTVIEKSIKDASGDNVAQKGEVLTYTIKVKNTNTLVDALNVPVRDMLIENTPSWLTYNDDATINPSITTTGDLKDGSYEVSTIAAGSSIEITYTMTMNEIPTDVANIINIATDNGETIDSCDENSKDCGSTIIPIDGDTALEKLVTDENGNGIAELGETLNYTIKVTNKDKAVATDVPVKDTLLEDTPSWLTFNDDVKLDPSDIVTTGDLTAGDFVIDSIDANGVVTITYSMTVNAIPSDVTDVTNIATDNGESTCDPDTEDCDTVVVPVEGDTVITKAVSDASGDNIVQANETLTYTLDVKNNTAADAHNVAVRDTLLENLPSWLTFNNDVKVNPTSTVTSGTLTGGDFTIDTVKPGEDIKITFTVTAGEIPDDVANVTNIATDNGKDTCTDEDKGTDCGEVVTPVEPDTSIDKAVKDENNDGKVEAGETLTYTLAVTNDNSEVDASNIPVRDTLLENLPDFVTFNNDVAVDPTGTDVTGKLTDGDFVIGEIPAGKTINITYSITVNSIPDDLTAVENIATDNGDLTCDEDTEDCESVIVPVVPNTVIEKSITDANADGFAQKDETLTYTIKVSNTNADVDALEVPVRDMLIENTPSWLTYNNDATIKPSVATSGSLNDGTYVVSQIDAGSSVEITYTMNLNAIPTDVDSIINIATDNGQTIDTCEEGSEDCDSTIIPIEGDAPVQKFVVDDNENGIAELGETLHYTLQITNSNKAVIEDMPVRDTLLENTPSWLTFNEDIKVDPSDLQTTGDLTNGDFVISEIPGNTTVNITYSMTVNEIPKRATDIENIVTNDGSNTCDPDTEHCDEVIVPVEGDTVITKAVDDENGDNIAQKGEVLTYTLKVKNDTVTDAHNVQVRDTLLENLPSWLTFNNDVKVDPSDLAITGDLQSGDFTIDTIKPEQEVNITFSVTVNSVPNDVSEVDNITTDNGTDTCSEDDKGIDCGEVVTPVEPDTSITKAVSDANSDGKVEAGETLTYTLDVSNNNTKVDAVNVPVRDTLLENLPSYVTFNNDVTLTPSTATSKGDLTNGDFTIDTIKANTDVKITYSVTINSIPDDVKEIINIATDNGSNTCSPDTDDCDEVVVPVVPNTIIKKAVSDANGDGFAQKGEKLVYTIEVSDTNNLVNATDVPVRDMLIENTPSWLTYNNDATVSPAIATSGDLKDGSYVLSEIPAGDSVTITYSMTMNEIPTDVTDINNIATDNGQTVDTCTDPEKGVDCDNTILPIDGDTKLEKYVEDEDGDGIAEEGETLTYTIRVTNKDEAKAEDIPVHDTLAENPPSWLTYNDDVVVTPSDTPTEGDLGDGTFVIDEMNSHEVDDITYTMTVGEIPADAEKVKNVVTNSGANICIPGNEDCDTVVDPVEGDTVIKKSVVDENNDNIVQPGEKLTYTLALTNNTATIAHNVAVRDTLLENLPSWLTFNNDVTLDPSDTVTSGTLTGGDFVVSEVAPDQTINITFSVMAGEIPDDVANVENIVTDNGTDTCPETDKGTDCDQVVTPVEPDTSITKAVKDENNDGKVEAGETLTYTLAVTNDNSKVDASNIPVRDTLLENLPDYVTFNNDVTIDPSEIATSGSLTDGDYTISEIKASQTVNITYSITVNSIPDDVKEVENIATDNGDLTCDEDTEDCENVVVPVVPNTVIEKSISDANNDGFAQKDEVLTYTIKVSNTNDLVDALDVPVRDMLIENTPSWLTYNNDAVISPTIETSGNLKDGTYVVSQIDAGSSVEITYSMKLNQIPTDADSIMNIATDNGETTDVCEPAAAKKQTFLEKLLNVKTELGTDCDSTIIPIDGDAPVQKFVSDDNENGIAEVGESLHYTLQINNSNKSVIENMPVRDTLLENTPSWLTFNNDVKVDPNSINTTGNLTTGDFVITEIPANTTVNITYSMTVNEIPSNATEIENIVTNDGSNTCDPDTEYCDEVIVPVEGDTVINKSVADENNDSIAQKGEVLTYTLDVKNNTATDAHDVQVRDTLLESLPSYLTFNNDVKVDPSDLAITGDLQSGDFTIDTIKPDQEVKITFSVTVNEIPNDVADVTNITTDNGTDTCTQEDKGTDCGEVVTPVEPDTSITKAVSDATEDGKVEAGETLTYTLDVTNNNTKVDATDVPVRDTLLENLPDYVTFNNDVSLTPTSATSKGDLTNGDFTIDTIKANSDVKITYSITVNSIPDDVKEVENIATVDGTGTCEPDTDKCDEVIVPVVPNTIIKKSVKDTNGDGFAQKDEVLTYTIEVTDTNELVNATDIPVRDMLIENTPSWLTYNDDATISPTVDTTGDLKDGSYEVSEINAGSSVEITYTMTMNEIPSDVTDINNIATDNGQTVDICTEPNKGVDCDNTILPIDGDTRMEKFVTDQDGDGIAEEGETLTYTIEVTNKDEALAEDIPVHDTLVEDAPSWLTYNDDATITPSDTPTEGDLEDGTFVIEEMDGHEVDDITYTMTVGEIPADAEQVKNIVTNSGANTCDPGDEDCDQVVDPVEGDTIIKKSVVDENNDNVVQAGEKLTYTLALTNNTATVAHNVSVRDTLLESLPSWLTFNNDVTIDPSETVTSGTLTGGDFVVSEVAPDQTINITFSVTAGEIPNDIANVENIVTDNGKDTCPDVDKGTDCDQVVTPVEPDTSITKSVKDENNDGKVQAGETLTYTLAVTNDNSQVNASNIPVRDTMLENIPDYVTFNNDVTIDPSDTATTGSLTSGDYTIGEIKAAQTVNITYSVTVNSIPDDIKQVENSATDNGDLVCDEDTEDCESVVVPVVPNTVIEKSITDANGDGFAQKDETLTYVVKVTNTNTETNATNVPVRDMLIENTPSWLTYNNDAKISPDVKTTGDLKDGSYTVSQIDAGSSIEITYTMVLNEVPTDADSIMNIATDNGETTDTCSEPMPAKRNLIQKLFKSETIQSTDCDSTIIPISGEAPVEKYVTDDNENGIAELGETLHYTLQIKNSNKAPIENMPVRDTLLENTPSWLTFNSDIEMDPSELSTTGDLTTGDYVISEIPGNTTVNITYSMTINEIPNDVENIQNIVTINGEETCDQDSEECDSTITPVEGDTVITKEVEDANNDKVAQQGEKLTYKLKVENNTKADAHDIVVRDSMLENLPSYLTYNNDAKVESSDIATTGDLQSGDFTLSELKAGAAVNISYSVNLNQVPEDVDNVTNIATDNGELVDNIDTCDNIMDDCASTVTPIEPSKPVDPTNPEQPVDPSKPEQPGTPDIPAEETDKTPVEVAIAKIVNTGQKYSILIIALIALLLVILLVARKKNNK